jgi:hypothetical protein
MEKAEEKVLNWAQICRDHGIPERGLRPGRVPRDYKRIYDVYMMSVRVAREILKEEGC